MISTCIAKVAGTSIFFQYNAPTVFGMISEKINIDKVKMPDMIATQLLPNSIKVIAPTLAAPTVLAIVFKLKIADKGRLIFSLKWDNFFPNAGRSFETKLIWACVTERIKDSSNEQKNDIPNTAKK